MTAAANTPGAMRGVSAIQLLGRKLDSIPFSPYHIGLILVLGLVGFVEGYDLALGGSLIVLAKGPLHLTGADIKWLVLGADAAGRSRGHRRLAAVRSLEPQGGHADRGHRQHVLHLADPAGAVGRPADRAAPADRHRPGLCDLGAVPDRRRADAGPAPPHLRRDLRSHAGQRLYPAAVYRLLFGRQRARLPIDRIAGRARPVRRPGAALFRPSRQPALAVAPRPAASGGGQRQRHHQARRQPGAAVDAGPARAEPRRGAGGIAALLGAVPPRPAALDHGRHPVLDRRRHLLLRLPPSWCRRRWSIRARRFR